MIILIIIHISGYIEPHDERRAGAHWRARAHLGNDDNNKHKHNNNNNSDDNNISSYYNDSNKNGT